MKAISPFALGATLYMPATRDDILDVVFGMKIPELRSLVVCLEDAVAAIDVESALANLQALLMGIQARGGRPEQGGGDDSGGYDLELYCISTTPRSFAVYPRRNGTHQSECEEVDRRQGPKGGRRWQR